MNFFKVHRIIRYRVTNERFWGSVCSSVHTDPFCENKNANTDYRQKYVKIKQPSFPRPSKFIKSSMKAIFHHL